VYVNKPRNKEPGTKFHNTTFASENECTDCRPSVYVAATSHQAALHSDRLLLVFWLSFRLKALPPPIIFALLVLQLGCCAI